MGAMGGFQNLMNYGLPLALGAGQWWQQRQARGRSEDIYQETKDIAANRAGEGMLLYGAGARGILDRAAGRTRGALEEFGAREKPIMEGYEGQASYFGKEFDKRTADITAKLEGLGTQARKDIDRRYGDVSTQRQQALSARGFGGSTVGAAVEMGVQREKGGELGRLEEGLRRENIGLQSQLTGQALGARMGLSQQALGAQQQMMSNRLNLMTGLSGDQLMAHQSLFGGGMNMYTGLSGDYLNTVGNVNVGYPSQANIGLAGTIGGGSYPVPDYGPSGWNQAMSGLGMAGNLTGSVFAGMGAFN